MADPVTEFKLARVETRGGALALVTMDNGADHTKPTVFSRPALESLARLLDELEDAGFAALVLTGKPYVFAAGADIGEFPSMTPELAAAGSRAGHELFSRLRALPFPTVAAINGACLGGGVEIALHCGYRAISTAVRHFACPECFLGIIPGWGGTQLVPRLVDPKTAVRFLVQSPMRQNHMLDGREAFAGGFADRLFEPAEFLDESLAFAVELVERGGFERPELDRSGLVEVVRKARAQLDGSVHGAAPAPYRALDLIEGSLSWTLEEGYRAEEEAIGDLMPGPQAQASIYAFDLVQVRAKRLPRLPEADRRPVRRVGIVGAGLMATQLGALFLRRLEVPVVLSDVKQELVEEALATIREELAGEVATGRYDEGKARFLGSLVSGSTSVEGFAGCDLVLEAVFEKLAVKRQVFAELEAVVAGETVLATNTSSLSVSAMAAGLARPERVVGMHFFNPVAVLPLVELVRAERTDDATLATAADVVRKLRKTAVLVRDAPAFVVNRILTRMMTVVLDSLERGNSVEEVDGAILRLGLPMPPSVLLQMVGPRVANQVLGTLHQAFPDRFPLSPTLAGYAEGRDEIVPREQRLRTSDEILADALAAIADEAGRLLEEGVVASAKDLDTAMLLGAGFPFWLGGITKHLDQTGISQRVLGRPLAEPGPTVLAC